MRKGIDTVDAAVEGVSIVELDPADQSVGYGGLPNELGVVELDACVMHGPTMRAGAVASIQNIKTPSRVALEVMRRTDHVLIVGAGALAFAKQMGFPEENLLTEASRRAWLSKRGHSRDRNNCPPRHQRRSGIGGWCSCPRNPGAPVPRIRVRPLPRRL